MHGPAPLGEGVDLCLISTLRSEETWPQPPASRPALPSHYVALSDGPGCVVSTAQIAPLDWLIIVLFLMPDQRRCMLPCCHHETPRTMLLGGGGGKSKPRRHRARSLLRLWPRARPEGSNPGPPNAYWSDRDVHGWPWDDVQRETPQTSTVANLVRNSPHLI